MIYLLKEIARNPILICLIVLLGMSLNANAQSAAPKLVLDASGFHTPWWSTGKPSVSGILVDTLRPWYGFGVRSAPWGVSTKMDTTGLSSSGRLHFQFRANKQRTIAFWLANDSTGLIVAKTFKSDTLWRSIDTSYARLNPIGVMPNSLAWQNNGGDTIFAELKDVRFISDTVQTINVAPPKISYVFISDSTVIHDRLCFGAYIVDTTTITKMDLIFNGSSIIDSPKTIGVLQTIQVGKDSLFAYAEWDVMGFSGWNIVGIRAFNKYGFGAYSPLRINIIHDTTKTIVQAPPKIIHDTLWYATPAIHDTSWTVGVNPKAWYKYISLSLSDSEITQYFRQGAIMIPTGAQSATTKKTPYRGVKP